MPKFSTFFLYLFIKNALKECETILDIGCGDFSPIRFLDAKTMGIDVYKPSIDKAKKLKTHNQYAVLNINNLNKYFKKRSFDAVVALDVIEHLPKDLGIKLINDIERIARKKVLILTPTGFLPQDGISEFDEHLSGWHPEDFKKFGYNIYGMYGHKFFRGSYHELRFRPMIFWAIISEISQWGYTFFHPKNSTALMAIKEINK
ncbi:MAG: class I SAM-dependent methyltransferase [Candidatus Levybacteria bacterium]|nr:class I SAM-dependent methyltransferase [Candidatus Levybacteria bacterium]